MDTAFEQTLLSRIRELSPEQMAEVSDFVEFLAAKSARRAALDRLLGIAPAMEAQGAPALDEDEIAAEVEAARRERRARMAAKAPGAARP